MADSDDSITLSRITRRKILSNTAALLAAIPIANTQAQKVSGSLKKENDCGDPAILIWQEWNTVQTRRQELCCQQQELETKLLHAVGSFPLVQIQTPGSDESFSAHTMKEIDLSLPGDDRAGIRTSKKIELAARQKAWDEFGEQLGYKRAFETEIELQEAECTLASKLLTTSARSIAGVAAKVHCILLMDDAVLDIDDVSNSPLQIVLSDLIRINNGA
nr:hypothetical protein [Brucella anthropi]